MKKLKLNSLELLDINLQLFADGEDDDSDNQPGAVDQDDENFDDDSYDDADFEVSEDDSEGSGEGEDDKQKKPDVADPDKSKQTPEENEAYKKIRQKAKADVLKELDAEKKEVESAKKEIEAFKQQQRNTQIEQKYFKEVTQELIEDLAYKEGIPEEFARKHLFELAKNNAIQEINAVNAKINQSQAQKAALKDKPYFKELEKDIDDLISKDPNIDVGTAYNYLRGTKLDELLASTKSNAEKRTLANVQDKARRRSVPSGGADTGLDVGAVLSKDDIEMSIAFGNDPRKIAKTVKEKMKTQKRR